MKMFLICLFGGCFGLHKFMERKIGLGILYLLTFGLFGIGWTIDCIVYLVKIFQTKPKTVKKPLPVPTPVADISPITPDLKKVETKVKGATPGLGYVYVNKKGTAYHWDLHCRSIGYSWDMMTREEARARGLKPCKHCDTY